MNFLEIYYTAIANKFDTDTIGAKKILENYIMELKRDLDNSNDDEAKRLWFEEFQGKPHPSTDDFLSAIFLFGSNPFIPKK